MSDTEEVAGAFLEKKDPESWRRLSEFVKNRRAELRLTQAAAFKAAGLGNVFWSSLESGSAGPRMYLTSAAGIERSLRWKSGSVAWVVLHDGEPTALEDSPDLGYLVDEIESLRQTVSDLEEKLAANSKVVEFLEPLAKLLRHYR